MEDNNQNNFINNNIEENNNAVNNFNNENNNLTAHLDTNIQMDNSVPQVVAPDINSNVVIENKPAIDENTPCNPISKYLTLEESGIV